MCVFSCVSVCGVLQIVSKCLEKLKKKWMKWVWYYLCVCVCVCVCELETFFLFCMCSCICVVCSAYVCTVIMIHKILLVYVSPREGLKTEGFEKLWNETDRNKSKLCVYAQGGDEQWSIQSCIHCCLSFIGPVYLVYCRIQSGTPLFVILDCW